MANTTANVRVLLPSIAADRAKLWYWVTVVLLAIAGVASRLPFQSTILHHWDSVNFALALEHFDVRLDQPHAPGTFVFYILLGRFFNLFLHDANMSLVWVSIITTAAAAATIFVLGTMWFDQRTGLTISLIMLTSPLIWFHGEVALSYMPEFCWVLLIVLACFKIPTGNTKALYAASLLIGLSGGIRPNTPIFMFPLGFVAVAAGLWVRKYTFSQLAIALLLTALGVALWVVPLVLMSGGPQVYWGLIKEWSAQHTEDSGSVSGMAVNAARLTMVVLFGLGVGVVSAICVVVREWRILKDNLLCDWRTQSIVLWLVPALIYFTFVHLRQPGHTFTILPALIVIAGFSTARVGRYFDHLNRKIWVLVTTLVVVGNGLFFLFGPANLFGSSRLIFSTPTRATIEGYDLYVTERLNAIRNTFDPEETIVIANSRNFRLPDFYLREYQETPLSYRLNEHIVTLPSNVHTLILFDDDLLPQISTGSKIQKLELLRSGHIRYFKWGDNQQASISLLSFDVRDR